MGKFIDFDAALEEAAEEPVVVRYLGRDWQLLTSMPAKPVLRILRLQAEGRSADELSFGEMLTFLSEMVPADVLEAWLDGGISVNDLGRLLRAVVAAYKGEEDEELGEARSPEEGPTSSSTGQSSRPTSPASTASISPEP